MSCFAQEYVRNGGNASAAYVTAGYSPNSVTTNAARLSASEPVARRIVELQAEVASRLTDETVLTVEAVIERYTAAALADPRELMEVRRGACRFCHGEDHAYQWRTPAEFERAQAAWASLSEAKRAITPAPDPAGGFGYTFNAAPHLDCPECDGLGTERTILHDTRNLSPGAAILFAGVKQTQHGIEIKTHDQFNALEAIAKHLGVFAKDNEQKSSGALLIAWAEERIRTKGSPIILNAAEKGLIGEICDSPSPVDTAEVDRLSVGATDSSSLSLS